MLCFLFAEMEDETERTPLKDLANNYNRNTENDVKCESGKMFENFLSIIKKQS